MDSCKICKGQFHDSPDDVLFCEHHKGFVHRGCCVASCSLDGKPCKHCKREYTLKK